MNPREGFFAEAIIIGDEQVDPSLGCAGELDRIGRPKGAILADGGVEDGGFLVERKQDSTRRKSLFVLLPQRFLFLRVS